jgi:CubicO group peptidase (beta-lactamase class C family)
MRWIAGILPLLVVSTAAASELVANPDADAKFQEIERSIYLYDAQPYTIPKAVEKNEVAGLSVVLIHDGKPAVHRTYGYRVKRKEERTTEQTIYQCASTSKMVSSLGIVTAARRGDLKLDQPITDFNAHYGDSLLRRWVEQYFTGAEAAWPREITLRRLLSHTAGLAVHGISAAPWLPSNDPLESILFGRSAFKDAVEPIHEPGTVWDYSGGGYTVAEAWLQIATGASSRIT